jgi:hypothetical protein
MPTICSAGKRRGKPVTPHDRRRETIRRHHILARVTARAHVQLERVTFVMKGGVVYKQK